MGVLEASPAGPPLGGPVTESGLTLPTPTLAQAILILFYCGHMWNGEGHSGNPALAGSALV